MTRNQNGGTLAVDIETASPFSNPDFNEFHRTEHFELVAIALGHQSTRSGESETEVLFRNGWWDDEHTADLLGRAIEWCQDRPGDRTLTYNGDGFDAVHLSSWGDEVGIDVTPMLRDQIDLKDAATERHGHRLPTWKDFPKFEDLCEWEGVETTPTYYDDYDIDPAIREREAVDSAHVQGKHIGKAIGEAYVTALVTGARDTATTRELERLLTDYARADVEPLFELDRIFSRSP